MAGERKPLNITLPLPGPRYDAENERQARRAIMDAIQRLVSSEAIGGENVATEPDLDALSAELDALVASLGDLAYLDVVTEDEISLSDVTTDNASTTKHGFMKKLPNTATTFYDGTGAFDTVKDSDLSTSDVTDNDVSSSKHGFAPKGDGTTTKFLNANGGYSVPEGSTANSVFQRTYFTQAARAIDTVYQNTTGYPVLVHCFFSATSQPNVIKCLTDSSNPPTTEVLSKNVLNGHGATFMFWVKNNEYYKITKSGTGGISRLTENALTSGTLSGGSDLGPSGTNARALTTVYQNTSGSTMFVQVIGDFGATNTFVGTSDSGSSPSTVVWSQSCTTTGRNYVWMIVPNNHYYKVTSGGSPTLIAWREYTVDKPVTKSGDLLAEVPAKRSNSNSAIGYKNISGLVKFIVVVLSNNSVSTARIKVQADCCPAIIEHAVDSSNVPLRSSFGITLPNDFYTVYHDAGTLTNVGWFEYEFG